MYPSWLWANLVRVFANGFSDQCNLGFPDDIPYHSVSADNAQVGGIFPPGN